MSDLRPLPEEGLDLLQELRTCQTYWVAQALHRTKGDRAAAAELLGINVRMLDWLHRALAPIRLGRAGRPTPASEAPTLPDLPKHRERSKVDPEELGRIDNGVHKVSRAVIRRLAGEGFTAKQIGQQLGVNFLLVEKVLRTEEIRNAGPKRDPSEGGPT